MAYNISTLIKIAENEVGYLEKATNSQLDDKLANAGNNNFTKYGKAQGCNGQPWCDAFVDWCFISAFGEFIANGLLHGFSNYTPTSAQLFQKKGLWASCKPCIGDVIFFKNSTRICHTGIVYNVDGSRVYTIEGNTSSGTTLVPNGGCVAKKSYPLAYAKIAGYGRPNYEGTDRQTIYKGCKGVPVGKMQIRLNEKFPNNKIVVDCDFGPATLNKLVEAQAMLGITNKGICDAKTWGKLCSN